MPGDRWAENKRRHWPEEEAYHLASGSKRACHFVTEGLRGRARPARLPNESSPWRTWRSSGPTKGATIVKTGLLLVFGLSLIFSPVEGSTREGPPRSPRNVPPASNDGIHHKITGRSMASVLRLFDRGVVNTVRGMEVDPLRQLLRAMDGAVEGRTSLLSLGEGRSSFVYQLLGERKYFLTLSQQDDDKIENIHAVDVSYPRHAGRSIIDRRRPELAPVADLDRYDVQMLPIVEQYPLNYHSQLFQHLDIRDSSGQPMKFSMIVSTFALSYVLLADSPSSEMRHVLERVLTHLAVGGVVLMTPVPQLGAPADLRSRIAVYNAVMDDLQSKGTISDFNRITLDFRAKKTPLVIIK